MPVLCDQSVMNVRQNAVVSPKLVKVVAAIIVGLSIGALVPPDAILLPVVGPVSGIIVGGIGLVTGALLYLWVPNLVHQSGCGCAGDCGCS